MKNLSINEYRDIIKYYHVTMPHNIHHIKKKGQMLLNKMLETNINVHNKIRYKLKSNHRKNIHCKTLKKKTKYK